MAKIKVNKPAPPGAYVPAAVAGDKSTSAIIADIEHHIDQIHTCLAQLRLKFQDDEG